MQKRESKEKLIILSGYIVLIVLMLVGVIGILYQMQKVSRMERSYSESENLITVSYVLATLYRAESIGNVIFLPDSMVNLKLFNLKDKLVNEMENGIKFLRKNSKDEEFTLKLDSVEYLLTLKNENEAKILLLLDSINKLPLQQKQITTVLSQRDLSHLAGIIRSHDTKLLDSTRIIVKNKSFGEKVGDLFRKNVTDSLTVVMQRNIENAEEKIPVDITLDTISQYLTNFVYEHDRKSFALTARITSRQLLLQHTNEELFGKINRILRDLEQKEFEAKKQFAKEQSHALYRSNRIGNIVALSALLIAISFITIIIRLIDKQKQYTDNLEKSKNQIENLLKNEEWMIFSISHDIKAPVSSILGYTDLLADKHLPENEQQYVQNMNFSAKQILELVNKLLNFHQLEKGQLKTNYVNFSPYIVVNETFMRFQIAAEKYNLEFILKNNLPKHKRFNSDMLFICQIINNLISNALKYTKKGTVTFIADLQQQAENNFLKIQVMDSGIGIPQNTIGAIFNRYERTKSAEIQGIEGNGLGLSIVKKMVDMLGGKIEVESKVDIGSKFTVIIPLLPDTAEEDTENTEQNTVTQPDKKISLLFVDDDELMLKVSEGIAKNIGYQTFVCNNPVEAVDFLKTHSIDLVFCDLNMPVMRGLELALKIKSEIAPAPPVVALSAAEMLSENEQAGFETFLQKPFSSAEIRQVVEKYAGKEKTAETQSQLSEIQLENRLVDTLNFNTLLAYADGDRKASLLILNTFISENTTIVKQIQQAIQKQDNLLIKDLAHKLLPRMQMINCKDIEVILRELEQGKDITDKYLLKSMIIKVNNAALEFIKKNLE